MTKISFVNRNKGPISVILSVVVAVLFVVVTVQAATTISTNISTDGSLTVTGASTFTGLGTFNGQLQATSTALFGGAVTAYSTVRVPYLTVGASATLNSLDGTILFASQTSDPTGVTQGTVYYNSTSKVLKLFDGTNWFTTGTTTSGISLSGNRLQLADLTLQYLTLGTTTQQGLSMMTLEATSTTAIPLSLVARNSQTANILNILDAGSAKLLYINSSGALFGSSTLQVTGSVTTYGATTLGDVAGDTITLTGNTSALGTLNVTGLTTLGFASTTALSLNGINSNFMVNGRATTTASSGDIITQGKLGVATTTASLEISADGSATTTVAAFSSGTRIGGCIQLEGANDVMYRIYATTTGPLITEVGSCK